jgi:hypothetical protein
MAKRYKIIGKWVGLGFMNPNDQIDIWCKPDAILEADEHTIWLITNGKKVESITTANAIDLHLKNGDIELIEDNTDYPLCHFDLKWELK